MDTKVRVDTKELQHLSAGTFLVYIVFDVVFLSWGTAAFWE
jgi:hypothetical protein